MQLVLIISCNLFQNALSLEPNSVLCKVMVGEAFFMIRFVLTILSLLPVNFVCSLPCSIFSLYFQENIVLAACLIAESGAIQMQVLC